MKRNQLNTIGLAVGAVEPITVAQVKSWAAIDTTLDDVIIEGLIVTAREMCENFISRDIVSKNYSYFIPLVEADSYGDYMVELPRPTDASLITLISDDNGSMIQGEGWEMYGVDGRVIKFITPPQGEVTISFKSQAILSANHKTLVESAIKSLVEELYDNRANLEGDEDIVVMSRNIKTTLKPAKYIYF